jgi:hypothetical protein
MVGVYTCECYILTQIVSPFSAEKTLLARYTWLDGDPIAGLKFRDALPDL